MTQKMLREFIDKVGIPFFDTQMGKGVIDERHPLYIGTAALSSKDILHKAVEHGMPKKVHIEREHPQRLRIFPQ